MISNAKGNTGSIKSSLINLSREVIYSAIRDKDVNYFKTKENFWVDVYNSTSGHDLTTEFLNGVMHNNWNGKSGLELLKIFVEFGFNSSQDLEKLWRIWYGDEAKLFELRSDASAKEYNEYMKNKGLM
jgi:hypothetical protein